MFQWLEGLLGSGTPQPGGPSPTGGPILPGGGPAAGGGPALLESLLSPAGQSRRRSNALTALGAQLLAASGPSTTRTSFGQAAGQGALAYLQAQQGEEDSELRRAHLAQQTRNLQLAEQEKAREIESARALENALRVQAGLPPLPPTGPASGAPGAGGMPAPGGGVSRETGGGMPAGGVPGGMPTGPVPGAAPGGMPAPVPGQGPPTGVPGAPGGATPLPVAGTPPRAPAGQTGGIPGLNLPPAVARNLLALPPDVRQRVVAQIVADQATHRPATVAPESFGAPQEVVDPNTGQRALVQFGSRGTVRPVQGYAPAPSNTAPQTITTADGIFVLNRDGTLGPRLGGAPSGEAPIAIPDPSSPTGFRYVPRSQASGQPAVGPSGLAIEFDPTTGRPISIGSGPGRGSGGANNPAGLAAPTLANLEEQSRVAGEQLARLSRVEAGFNPEWLQAGPRIGQTWNAWRETLGGTLPPDDAKRLADFTTFRADTVENLNRTIKDITGAAMTQGEAERITQQVPNAGTGIFDGDSPTVFKAKLDRVTSASRNALLRAQWARLNGLDLPTAAQRVPLDEVPALINRRGAEIEAQLRAASPNISADALRSRVRDELRREFGIR